MKIEIENLKNIEAIIFWYLLARVTGLDVNW